MSSASGPVTKDQVLQALNALYQGTDNVARVQAGNWLEMFQKTVNAWTVSDQIIQDDSTNLTEKTFAAQTFRNKITYDLTQLDFAARASLRDSLVNLLVQHKSSPIALVTQLCLALVDLIIQMPEWANVYGQIKELFSQDEASASILLQILTLLPEELTVNTRIPLTDEEYRTRTMELLEANSADVLSLLLLYLQSTGADTSRQNRVLLCLLAWLRTGYLPMQAVGDSPMVRLAFEALGSEDLFDTACDLIVTMVQETQEVEEHLSLIPTLCELLQGVHARLVSLEEEADDDDDDDDEVETRRGLCRILTHAGEAYIVLLVKHAESFQGLVQALLTCARQRDLECVGMTLYFWESFTHYLLASSSEATSPLELYTPLFQRLEDTMIRHLQYPRYAFPDLTPGGALTSSENSSTWTLEERDAFRDFRHRMGDTLKDCADALGPEAALKRPLSLLLRHIQTYGQGGPGQGSWQAIEAPLFSLRALGSRVPLSEEEVMPKIMEILSQLPPHPKLRYAATLVISRYTPWTAAHPAFLTYQLNFISSGFDPKLGGGSPEVIQAAAVALNYLCQDCGPMLVDSLGQLHSFYLDVSSRLSPMDLSEVTQALAHVIGAIPDPDRLLEVLRTFSHPILQDLCSLVPADGTSALDPAEMNARATRAIAVFLGHLRPLRRQTDGSHPALPLVLEVLPVLSSLLTAFRGHGEFGESISQCYRTLVDTYGDALTPYLSDLLGLFGEAYTATGLSTYIWVSRRCVRAYGRNPAQVEVIASFVEAMSRVVLGRIK
ncbi:MAG: armadillo-type protein, partial [Piptocephalis tieghemiana]